MSRLSYYATEQIAVAELQSKLIAGASLCRRTAGALETDMVLGGSSLGCIAAGQVVAPAVADVRASEKETSKHWQIAQSLSIAGHVGHRQGQIS